MTAKDKLYTKLILIALKDNFIEDQEDYYNEVQDVVESMCTYSEEQIIDLKTKYKFMLQEIITEFNKLNTNNN